MQGLVERLEQAVGRLELLSAVSHRPPGNCGEINGVNGGVAPSVEAFDKLMNSTVAEFLKKSRILAGDVETHAEMVHSAFQAQRAFLLMASQYQQPQEGKKWIGSRALLPRHGLAVFQRLLQCSERNKPQQYQRSQFKDDLGELQREKLVYFLVPKLTKCPRITLIPRYLSQHTAPLHSCVRCSTLLL
ncbi:Adenylyl cyclase-associated protein 2 [Myotis davidii]|uniref:Adenylyl cyclase-associated protein 2 n=1 Tax=Myotis davidii TaxID=225400 RepID=L5LVA3_MYODS|nr:Adenylyl cyclase-associated protein 2 [Myotis davidii]